MVPPRAQQFCALSKALFPLFPKEMHEVMPIFSKQTPGNREVALEDTQHLGDLVHDKVEESSASMNIHLEPGQLKTNNSVARKGSAKRFKSSSR